MFDSEDQRFLRLAKLVIWRRLMWEERTQAPLRDVVDLWEVESRWR